MMIGFGGGRWGLAGSEVAVAPELAAGVGVDVDGEGARFTALVPCTAVETERGRTPGCRAAAAFARIASEAAAEAARAAAAVADDNMEAETDADRLAALAPDVAGAAAPP